MVISLCTGWAFVGIWALLAAVTLGYNAWWAFVLFASTALFALVLIWLTGVTITESFDQYTFEMTATEAILTSYNRLSQSTKTLMVVLDDIKFVEYYPYRDCSSMILHAGYCDMEVPLWPMGSQSQDILDFLQGRGLRIINVQSDESFPT